MHTTLPLIVSGQFDPPRPIRDYRAELLGDVWVERAIWGRMDVPFRCRGIVVADADYIWFRFWLPAHDQVVERYYDPKGVLVGTQIDVCMALACSADACRATDLLLDIWIDPMGQVTVDGEDAFEEAVRLGLFSASQSHHAEAHLRDLTAAIARRRFPPPLVRNWQIDPSRIAREREILKPPSSSALTDGSLAASRAKEPGKRNHGDG